MTAPVPASPDPADLWDYLVSKGLSGGDATRHVMRMLQNQPEAVRREYLKDVDPGKLAAFGLGAADMASFGLGDQIARTIEGQEATDTQQAAQANHPTAHLLGEIAGVIGPAGAEYGLAKAGKLVPTAVGKAVRAIQSRPLKALAQTGVNAATGAALAGGQAAGRTEGSAGKRLQAAERIAPVGALLGAAAPLAIPAAKATFGPWAGRFLDNVVGKAPAIETAPKGLLMHTAGDALSDISQAQADFAAKKISQADLDAAMDYARLQMRSGGNGEGLLSASPRVEPDALASPAYQRRGLLPVSGKPGHPVWRGEGAPTRTLRTEPLTPSVEPQNPATALLRKQSASRLRAALAKPETPSAVKQLIQIELKRRRG